LRNARGRARGHVAARRAPARLQHPDGRGRARTRSGIGLDATAAALKTCGGAPGRFERVAHAGDFAVVVDYAHTDDALRNVLRTARDVSRGRVITVFGCGGDRDRTKRAPMGEAAASLE
jgi:UDP-N-acetylmuramoyl-L-alanyl-D-glutamate--2,6-diaminopimelate ligase